MAKRQVQIQESVETEEDFKEYLEAHAHQLICMEVYCEFCGNCQAATNAIRKAKLEIGQDNIVMAKACADNIGCLARFRDKSEPTFLMFLDGKLTTIVFGADGIVLCDTIESLIRTLRKEQETGVKAPIYRGELDVLLPSEIEKIEYEQQLEQEHLEAREHRQTLTLAARKIRVCQRLAEHTRRLNFILFWPHNHKAHFELYEKWDELNINVAAKEEMQFTEEMVTEVLYQSDVDPNDACVYHLMNGKALVVLFKMYDDDNRDFVHLMRHAIYEEIPIPKEDVPPEKQLPPIPAYERYATISKTAREVRRERYEAKMQKLREEEEERERLEKERQRLAKQEEEERLAIEKQKKEEQRMARIAAGLPASPEPEPEPEKVLEEGGEEAEDEEEEAKEAKVGTEGDMPEEAVVEEEVAVEEEFQSDVEVEDEPYIPPGGLFVPGLYSPPNELAKANGLKLLFPKVVRSIVPIESEHYPPHVLVIFNVDKRQEVFDIVRTYPDEILHYGFFTGDEPSEMEHVAFSLKQYNNMTRLRKHLDRLAVAVSRKRSLPLLQLAGLNPHYISSDLDAGEKDCLTIFPVGYGDEFVEEESVVEEEAVIQDTVTVVEEAKPEAKPEEEEEEEDEED